MMGQILKLKKKVRKSARSKSGRITLESIELKKLIGKEVIITVSK